MIIQCGKWNWRIIFPFIYSASLFSRSFSSSFPSNNPFLPLILVTLSQLSIGIATRFLLCNESYEEYSFKDLLLTNSKNIKIIRILWVYFLGFINLFIIHFLLLREGNLLMKPYLFQRETIIYGIIFSIFLYNLIIIGSYHRGIHQKVSIAFFIDIIIALTIVWFLVPFRQIHTNVSDIIIQIIILVISEAFFVTKHLIEQKMLYDYYMCPYSIVLCEGIGSLLGLGVLMILYKFIGCFSIFDVCSKEEYIYPFTSLIRSFTNYKYILMFLPCSILIELFIILTAQYRAIIERSIFNLLFAFIRLVTNMNSDIEIYGIALFIMNIILNVIAFFWSLVFLEYIELRFCDLNRDIYKPEPGPLPTDDILIKKNDDDILMYI